MITIDLVNRYRKAIEESKEAFNLLVREATEAGLTIEVDSVVRLKLNSRDLPQVRVKMLIDPSLISVE